MPSPPRVDVGIQAVNDAISAALPAPSVGVSINPMQVVIYANSIVWLIGIAALLLYSVLSLIKLKLRLKDAVMVQDNIYTSKSLVSPFVMGIFRPKIYLPEKLSGEEQHYIILHEQTHMKHFDHVIKLLSFFVLCLHWFNPLVWVAFFALGRDMEMSCDEAVIKRIGNEMKRDYSSSLLALATGKRIVGATPLAFGEGDTKVRIKNILQYKKPAFWVAVVAIIAVVAVGIGLLANPKSAPKDDGYAGVDAVILEIDAVNKTMLVSGVGANSIIGDQCFVDCKEASVTTVVDETLNLLSFEKLKVKDTITMMIGPIKETYPTGTTAQTIQVNGNALPFYTSAEEVRERYMLALLASDIVGMRLMTPALNPPAQELIKTWKKIELERVEVLSEDIREKKAVFELSVTVKKAPDGFGMWTLGTATYYLSVEKCDSGWYVESYAEGGRMGSDLETWWSSPSLFGKEDE